jgi:zeaxanthin glucosyltransferase
MKIGFVCIPLSGHLNPMTALARKLQSRGHEISFISVLDGGPIIQAANLNFVPFCETEFPSGSIPQILDGLAQLHGLEVTRYWFQNMIPGLSEAALKHLPKLLKEKGIEALVFDMVYRNPELLPMHLDMPYAQVWNGVHSDFTGSAPLFIFDWPYDPSPQGLERNRAGLMQLKEFAAPLRATAVSYAEKVGLQIDWTNPSATLSKLAVISQMPEEFDFPNPNRLPQFRYAGPFHDNEGREPVPFAWEKLTGKPLIYASLGTLVNRLEHIYRTILQAVEKFPDVQMVLSVGRNINPDHLGPIPSNTIVVAQAPQIELLQRAELCITHAGLNTALESLANGVPMVAIPIAFDQPGVAARIAYHGVGEFLSLDHLSTERLSDLLQKVRNNPDYKAKAAYFQKVIEQTHGLDVAADALEEVFTKALA